MLFLNHWASTSFEGLERSAPRIAGLVSVERSKGWKQKATEVRATTLFFSRPERKGTFHLSKRGLEVNLVGATIHTPPPKTDSFVLEIQSKSQKPRLATFKSSRPTTTTRLCFSSAAERGRWVAALQSAGAFLHPSGDDGDGGGEEKEEPFGGKEEHESSAYGGSTHTEVTAKKDRVAKAVYLQAKAPSTAASAASAATGTNAVATPEDQEEVGEAETTAASLASLHDFVPQTAETPPDVIPTRYLVNSGGDQAEALKRWQKTHEWRKSVSE